MVEIIKNAAYFAWMLGIGGKDLKDLKVAIVSANEDINGSITFSKESAQIRELNWPFTVVGPISIDLATYEPSVQAKSDWDGPIKADADILIFHDLITANVVYKMIAMWMQRPVASLTTDLPVDITSRGDSVITKYYTLLLTMILEEDKRRRAQAQKDAQTGGFAKRTDATVFMPRKPLLENTFSKIDMSA
jgi:phosphotransacetylase